MNSTAEPAPWLASPTETTPPRRRPSVRRTTTHDCTRPDGLDGPVSVVATGRDLLTRSDGTTKVLDECRLDVRVRYLEGSFLAIDARPPAPGLASLVGSSFHRGFRPGIETALPGESASHSVRFQLLDELPAAAFASGRALRVAGIAISLGDGPPTLSPSQIDLCAGWRDGGAAVSGYTEAGPPLHIGSIAPDVEAGDDPHAWHTHAPLPPHGTCRRRRLDLWEEDGRVRVDCFFRDHHVDADGVATVVHEWTLRAELDPATMTFTAAEASQGPLPFADCLVTPASAQRLPGMSIDGIRRTVRKEFGGPTTCTHLNDTFRSLEDLGALLDALRMEESHR